MNAVDRKRRQGSRESYTVTAAAAVAVDTREKKLGRFLKKIDEASRVTAGKSTGLTAWLLNDNFLTTKYLDVKGSRDG